MNTTTARRSPLDRREQDANAVLQVAKRLHAMEPEWYTVPGDTAAGVNEARAEGRRVIHVGTTTMKAVESAAREDGTVAPGSASSDLFIYPGYEFRCPPDMLLTNFHLPRSTLLMLVCAYAGRGRVLDAYREAVREGYRFYSFGDAMMLEPSPDVRGRVAGSGPRDDGE